MSGKTKERILDVAERLFADKGFDATSLREITTEAEVNLAAVNYYFRSKEALVQEVFARRLGPLNKKRLEMLDDCEAVAGDAPPDLEAILRAFFVPAFEFSRVLGPSGQSFMRLMGRIHSEPQLFKTIFQSQFGELARRYIAAVSRALPQLPKVELFWRIHFMVGSLAHTLCSAEQLEFISGGLCDVFDFDSILERLVAFNVSGMRAELSPKTSKEEQ